MEEYIDNILRDFLEDNEMFILEDIFRFVNESLPKDNQTKLVREINFRVRAFALCLSVRKRLRE